MQISLRFSLPPPERYTKSEQDVNGSPVGGEWGEWGGGIFVLIAKQDHSRFNGKL